MIKSLVTAALLLQQQKYSAMVWGVSKFAFVLCAVCGWISSQIMHINDSYLFRHIYCCPILDVLYDEVFWLMALQNYFLCHHLHLESKARA